ncbi:hypothetical protein GCM10022217_26130 [Chryseobacterium ginsenosidimutans]
MIRNPVYCGLILININPAEQQMVKEMREALISERQFYDVQSIITTKRQVIAKADTLKATFFLRGFLICPHCNQKLSGSDSFC